MLHGRVGLGGRLRPSAATFSPPVTGIRHGNHQWVETRQVTYGDVFGWIDKGPA